MTFCFSDAYNEGYAYENGFVKNPYTYDEEGYGAWEDGWGDAWTYWNDDPT